MKKTFLTLTVCILATASVLAQGRINFSNSSATPIRIMTGQLPPNDTVVLGTASTAIFGVGPASARIQLYAGTTTATMIPVFIGPSGNLPYVTNTASTTAFAQGTFNGGSQLILPAQPIFLQFRATLIDLPHSGVSSIIQVTPAPFPAAATEVFSPIADASHWDGILIAIPEPSSLALLGVGSSLLFFARRRK